jgi:hypothetical protein
LTFANNFVSNCSSYDRVIYAWFGTNGDLAFVNNVFQNCSSSRYSLIESQAYSSNVGPLRYVNNTFTGNKSPTTTIYLPDGYAHELHNNSFIGNRNAYDLYTDEVISATNPIDARFNYWGSEDEAYVQSRIYDRRSNSAKALIIYWEYLLSPDPNDIGYNHSRRPFADENCTVNGLITEFDITIDTVLCAVYNVTGSIIVSANTTVTILPGVKMVFSAGTSVTVVGALVARGTSAQPIFFRGKNPTGRYQWTQVSDGKN